MLQSTSKSEHRLKYTIKRCLMSLLLMPLQPVFASPNDYNQNQFPTQNSASSNQPPIKWYRYYNNKGEPSLSSTITEAHLAHGYEALDNHMQVVKRVPPFSTSQYEGNQRQRQADSQQAYEDSKLKRGYGSAEQATIKRDRELAELESQKKYMLKQLTTLQTKQNQTHDQVSKLEQQKKPIPPYLRINMNNIDQNVSSLQQNLLSLERQEQQAKQQFAHVIQRLTQLERQGQ